MKNAGILSLVAVVALVVVACGAGSEPSQTTANGPAEAPTTGIAPSADAPVATDSTGTGGNSGTGGGGKPAGWDQHGKVHVEMSGPVSKSADYGFLPAGSFFGGDQGSALNFTVEGTNEVVSVLMNPDGTVVVSYAGVDFQMPGAECTTSNWNVGSTSGSGSFDCTAAIVILGSGALAQDGKIKGSFEAQG